tara:strand:- start:913 stop:1278 length:366 start_codon:yes stop_codon:yes gene_type:complete
MEISIYTLENKKMDSIANFLEFYYSFRLKHLASDLLEQGLSPTQITEAVVKAMTVGKSSGLDMDQHFRPVFTGIQKQVVSDCKLSHLAYGLVLMNADSELQVVGDFQISVLQEYIGHYGSF